LRGRAQVTKCKWRSVVESLTRCLPQCSILIGDFGIVKRLLHVQYCLLCWFENGVKAADNDHGQNNVPILATNIDISENVVGNAPDEIRNPVQVTVAYKFSVSYIFNSSRKLYISY
jgi:hypothetical protein